MTDRELLGKAAKAQGWRWSMADVCWYDDQAGTWKREKDWNPLTDDGDALRLAVVLGLVVDCSRPSAGMPFTRHAYDLSEGGNNAEATRRAIVRAAAAIGETP